MEQPPFDDLGDEIRPDDPRYQKAKRKQQKKGNANGQAEADKSEPPLLQAYVPRPFDQIPPRQWLHAKHYVRQHVVMTVAPGAYGKTSLVLCNAIEMATAKGLLGPPPKERYRVLYWNGEDPPEEIERRIAAICLHYKIEATELQDWLFTGQKLKGKQRLARLDRHQQLSINQPMLHDIEHFIQREKIDCVIIDPLLPFHHVPERLNEVMEEMISSTFGVLVERQNCCIELSHHTRKTQSGAMGELSVDDSRGGGAVTNMARSVRILNRMTEKEATLPNIPSDERRYYLRVNRDKPNLAPAGSATWVHLSSQELPNGPPGDSVQVVEPWKYPQPFDNVTAADMHWMRAEVVRVSYRSDPRSKDWVGVPLADRLDLDIKDKSGRSQVNTILKTWFKNGALATEVREDKYRTKREFVIPGPWKDPAAVVDDE
jgi:hypothetical protein